MKTTYQSSQKVVVFSAFLPGVIVYLIVCAILQQIPGNDRLIFYEDGQIIGLPFVYYLVYNLFLLLLLLTAVVKINTKDSVVGDVALPILSLLSGCAIGLATGALFGVGTTFLLSLGYSLIAGVAIGIAEEFEFNSRLSAQRVTNIALLYAGLSIGGIIFIFLNSQIVIGVFIAIINIAVCFAFDWMSSKVTSVWNKY